MPRLSKRALKVTLPTKIDPMRSRTMRAVKSFNTKPELIVRRYLWKNNIRYRVNAKGLPGKPDIVLHNRKLIIFVHGCFWHGHIGCPNFRLPKTRTEWWDAKIQRTMSRDARSEDELIGAGWTVMTVWECQLKDAMTLPTLIDRIRAIPPRKPRL